jgi:hypothetical protein
MAREVGGKDRRIVVAESQRRKIGRGDDTADFVAVSIPEGKVVVTSAETRRPSWL